MLACCLGDWENRTPIFKVQGHNLISRQNRWFSVKIVAPPFLKRETEHLCLEVHRHSYLEASLMMLAERKLKALRTSLQSSITLLAKFLISPKRQKEKEGIYFFLFQVSLIPLQQVL